MEFKLIFGMGGGIYLDVNNGQYINDYYNFPINILVDDVVALLGGADPIKENWDTNLGDRASQQNDFDYPGFCKGIEEDYNCFVVIKHDELKDYQYEDEWKHIQEFGAQFKMNRWTHYGTYLVGFNSGGCHVIWDSDEDNMYEGMDYEWIKIYSWDHDREDTILSIAAGVYLLLPNGELESYDFPLGELCRND